jgi:predicted dehydrogenase/threonine dehydrogenase-like Zn-dependent dehydrogenase
MEEVHHMVKQIGQNYRDGRLSLEEVAYPALQASGVIIRTAFSVISMGTEGMKVREARMNLLEKARARPDQLKQVLDTVRQQGVRATFDKVMSRLGRLTPLGYSLSGFVVDVGDDVDEFHVGQRVAAAGAEFANHGEYNFVPRNLVVPIADDVALDQAAFGTIGAIAMHAFRQSRAALGETALVIGMGLIGQVALRILSAAGVRTVVVDLDAQRCEMATAGGAVAAGVPNDLGWRNALSRMTGGHGADVVLICAGGSDNSVLELAASAVRDRGRIVVVGKTRLDLDYNTFFRKEIEVAFSRSYGPGRYDPAYEIESRDYPYSYVRWTERRNIEAFIDLLAARRIDLAPLVGAVRDFDRAVEVYDELHEGKAKAIGILLDYGVRGPQDERPARVVQRLHVVPSKSVSIGVIGAGNYASSMLLPPLKADPRVAIRSIVTATGLSAASAAQRFDAATHGTSSEAVFNDPAVAGVVIATRHASHARLVSDALRAGKAVFVEKPLAVDAEGLALVDATVGAAASPRVMVGFNRRFSPAIRQLVSAFAGKRPLTMVYRVQAGALPADAWQRAQSEGGRFIGEAGHFFDVFQALSGSEPAWVAGARLAPVAGVPDDGDNMSVVVGYADGSVGTLVYVTQGGAGIEKEYLEVHGAGQSAVMRNFTSVELYGADGRVKRQRHGGDKGQAAQMQSFVDMIENGDAAPVRYETLANTTRLTWCALEAARAGETRPLA